MAIFSAENIVIILIYILLLFLPIHSRGLLLRNMMARISIVPVGVCLLQPGVVQDIARMLHFRSGISQPTDYMLMLLLNRQT